MLEYENQLLLDAVQDSQLFIFARGISTEKVLTHLFQIYGVESQLVFVLSATPAEESYYRNKIPSEKVISITTEFTAAQRKELYVNGGVFFITCRILIVDFLKGVVPAEQITGMIVLRAHNVIESSQEAFILRLYRSKNKTGFIKAFSQSPTRFLLGFSKVTSVMRSCFIANLSLWPRFHIAVKESLKTPDEDSSVIEIQLKLTEEMAEIQSNFLDLINCSISELKRLIPTLNDEDVTTELALTKNFEKIIRSQIDPIWNTISAKAKEILSDLKIFRLLLSQLTRVDCISFYSTLCNYTSSDAVFKTSWVLSSSADKVIEYSKKRLLPAIPSSKSKDKSSKKEFQPEVCPKWLALTEILGELCIKQEERSQTTNLSQLKTIIFAEDLKTCSILRDYLSYGSQVTLGKLAKSYDNVRIELPAELIQKLESIAKKNKVANAAAAAAKLGDTSTTEKQTTLTQIERKYEDVQFLQHPIFIRPLKSFGDAEAFGVAESLETLRPDVIIIFDPELQLIRTIEVHRARMGQSQSIRVYFLVFRNSIEEQLYLTSIQREKIAFEKLIQEKSTMVVPNEREGRDELNQDLWRDPTKASETVGTNQSRRNMENKTSDNQTILVDMREFRSELPSLLHKRGIDLEPLTLDVGDYILTPEICVERKSISDLIGSLNSGRLYKQAEAMGRHYKKPVLLIEHSSSGNRDRNDLTQIMPKLQLLTINFPNLKIIWSPGAHYTSEIFQELKRGKPEPNPNEALAITKESTGTATFSKYNPISHSFLSKLPGINSQNVYVLLNRFNSLVELFQASESEIEAVLENKLTSNILYNGIHSNLLEEQGAIEVIAAKLSKGGGGGRRPGPSSRMRR